MQLFTYKLNIIEFHAPDSKREILRDALSHLFNLRRPCFFVFVESQPRQIFEAAATSTRF